MPTLSAITRSTVSGHAGVLAADILGTACGPAGHSCSSKFVKLATIPGIWLPLRDEAINRTL